MLLDQSQAESRLGSESNLATRFGKKESNVTVIEKRQPGNNRESNLSRPLRNLAATLVRAGMTQREVAKDLGITQPAVSYLASEKAQTVDQEKVQSGIEKVQEVAVNKLMLSLGLMTEEKLENCKATDLSQIAANMSRVVEKTTPKQVGDSQVNFIVYAPQQRQESGYRTIEVGRQE